MRPPTSPLLLAVLLCLIGAGCASRPAQEEAPAATAARDGVCPNAASDTLHWVSRDPKRDANADPEVESLLTQPSADPRLAQINRRMYLTLHSLDVELRKEQQLEGCEQPSPRELEAQSGDGVALGRDYSSGLAAADRGSRAPTATGGSEANNSTAAAYVPSSLAGTSTGGSFARPGSVRKAGLPSGSGSGNGATAPNISPGSDNDVVARRLRRAAEQETDPKLRAKLWKEYTDYEQGTSAK